MPRCSFIVVFALLLAGCQHRPFLMRGAMNVDGTMDMAGSMNMTGDMNTSMKTDNTASELAEIVVSGSSQATRKIAIIDVDGLLVDHNQNGFGSMGENPVALFHEKLQVIADDSSIAAVVLRVNSPGGGVTASDIMAHDLMRLKQQRPIPVVACLMSVGAGGGYYLATNADAIVAHPTSIVGGIGVILNLYNMEDTMGQFNVLSMSVKSGEKIDAGSPERELEPAERKLLQQMADSFHERFIAQVQSSRPNLVAAEALFDGRVMSGTQALEVALVDQVGYMDDAIATARTMAGLGDDASIVMLRRDNDRAYTVLDVSPNEPLRSSLIPLKLPGLDRASLPTFMYLWQPEPSIATN
jgi:protease-4